ncbi:MAG: TlpA family protein disulfide reductase [Saprospiraceae bacterium]|nr:TlpA family protein disulfide reductase [Saprospiraceae bacterium]
MKKLFATALLAGVLGALPAQDIPFVKADQLTAWKNSASDTVYVLNFWATWCAPCVAELPEFEKLHEQYAGQPVQVILISNDFRRDVEKKLIPFVRRKKLKSRVVFLDERTPNDWIDLVSTEWTGAIPATLIVRKNRNYERFFEKRLHFDELDGAVREALGQ